MLYEMNVAQPRLMTKASEERLAAAAAARKDPVTLVALRRTCAVAAADMLRRLEAGATQASVAEDLAVGMLCVASAVAVLGADPDENDLVAAAMAAIAEAFNALDKALLLNNWDGASAAAVQVELVLRGLAATLGLPYAALLQSAAACADDPARRGDEVRALLRASGLARPAS